MNNKRTETHTNTALSFISREIPEPQYEADQAKKGIHANATISDAIDFGRANVDFSNHPDLSDTLSSQQCFGCTIVIPWMALFESYDMAH